MTVRFMPRSNFAIAIAIATLATILPSPSYAAGPGQAAQPAALRISRAECNHCPGQASLEVAPRMSVVRQAGTVSIVTTYVLADAAAAE
jgi:hypothetical protein